jgi:hypothetical protein
MRILLTAVHLAFLGGSACTEPSSVRITRDSTTAIFCQPADGRVVFGLNVAVRDSVTGRAIPANVWAEEGLFAEPLIPGPNVPGTTTPASYLGVADRPGKYSVTVIAAGFRLWRRSDIVVRSASGCHVESVTVTAVLQPAA